MDALPASGIDSSLFQQLNAFKYVQVTTLSVLTWEVVSTMHMEFALYKKGVKFTYILLGISRYYTIACLALDTAFNILNNASSGFCNDVRWVLPFLASTVQFVSVPLLLLRTYAIWGRRKWLLGILFICWVVPMAIGAYVCTLYSGIPYSEIVRLDVVGGCGNDPKDNVSAAAPYIANAIVDSIILFLTLGRLLYLKRESKSSSIVRRILVRDGLLYYIVVVVVNVVNLVFFMAPGLSPLVRPLIATPASVAPTIMIGRLFFNLQHVFFTVDDTVQSDGSNYRRRGPGQSISIGTESSRGVYPLQPLQVAVKTTKDTYDPDLGSRARGFDGSIDLKRNHVAEYP